MRKWCKAAAVIVLMAATALALAIGEGMADADSPAVHRTVESAPDCSAKYAALLDLAELARRDGKSSEVVVRGLSEQGGAMSECLPANRRGADDNHQ
ncbi:hypothetical protein [Paraburkholderia fungorum]|uniref:hypothetical protein n=1 Tax=Paraburkholderia fungorum TaxID=134537 RepID=UPI0038B6DE27